MAPTHKSQETKSQVDSCHFCPNKQSVGWRRRIKWDLREQKEGPAHLREQPRDGMRFEKASDRLHGG